MNLGYSLELKGSALAGNRTRASRVAGENSTTEPPMLTLRTSYHSENKIRREFASRARQVQFLDRAFIPANVLMKYLPATLEEGCCLCAKRFCIQDRKRKFTGFPCHLLLKWMALNHARYPPDHQQEPNEYTTKHMPRVRLELTTFRL